MSMGATGCFSVGSWTTPPPQRSTAASKPLTFEATMTVCRPPEHVPMTPTLPLLLGWARSHFMAASQSAATWESATPPSARTAAATSSGVPWPFRQYRSGAITE